MTEPTVDADAFNAFEAAGWHRQSAGYDDFFGSVTTRVVEPSLDAAGVMAGLSVLDVASGPGYVAARAAERGASVAGVDVAESMVALARLLRRRGFREVAVETIAFTHPAASADALWHGLLAGTVRTSALIFGQAEEMQQQIRAAFDRIVQQYEAGGRLELPVSVKLASGEKP